jgi:hypothetical protein
MIGWKYPKPVFRPLSPTGTFMRSYSSKVCRISTSPAPILRTMTRDPQLSRVLLGKMNERTLLLNLIGSPRGTGMANRP